MFNPFKNMFAKMPEAKLKSLEGQIAAIDSLDVSYPKDAILDKYNPSELVTRKGLTIFDRMRNDDQIKPIMSLRKSIVIGTGWRIVSPEGRPEDWEPTVFVEENLRNLTGTFERALIQMLSSMEYGYSVTEKIFKMYDGKVWIDKLSTIMPHDITFHQTKFGELMYIEQSGFKMDPMKFIILVNDYEFSNHYGSSDFISAYPAWWSKENAIKWLAMLLERHGIPPIIALYNDVAYAGQLSTKLQTLLKRIQTSTVGMVPRNNKDDLEFWTPQLANNVQQAFIPALEHYDAKIARALLMPNQLGVTNDNETGSYARAKVNFDIFLLSLQRIREELQEYVLFENIIKPLIDLNFGGEEYPRFEFLPLTDNYRAEIFNQWATFVDKGVVKHQFEDEVHVRKTLGFPDREMTDADKQEAEDAAKAKESDESQDDKLPDGEVSGESADDGDESGDGETSPQKKDDDSASSGSEQENTFAEKYSSLNKFSLSREKNVYEKSVNFAAIDKALTEREIGLITTMREMLVNERDSIVKRLKSSNVDLKTVKVRSTLESNLYRATKASFLDAAKAGDEDIRAQYVHKSEKFASKPGYIQKHAEKWLIDKAKDVSGVISDNLQKAVKIILSNAIKNGIATGEIVAQIQDAFLPYIGNDNIIEDDEVLEPYRIETIVRTNITQSFNQGRLVATRDPELTPFVAGMEYSAIMDSRTTSICQHLDGRIFAIDDPNLDRLTPPNHFNCRSVLVPVFIDQQVDKKDLLGPADIGKALELSGKGFV